MAYVNAYQPEKLILVLMLGHVEGPPGPSSGKTLRMYEVSDLQNNFKLGEFLFSYIDTGHIGLQGTEVQPTYLSHWDRSFGQRDWK